MLSCFIFSIHDFVVVVVQNCFLVVSRVCFFFFFFPAKGRGGCLIGKEYEEMLFLLMEARNSDLVLCLV